MLLPNCPSSRSFSGKTGESRGREEARAGLSPEGGSGECPEEVRAEPAAPAHGSRGSSFSRPLANPSDGRHGGVGAAAAAAAAAVRLLSCGPRRRADSRRAHGRPLPGPALPSPASLGTGPSSGRRGPVRGAVSEARQRQLEGRRQLYPDRAHLL